MRRAVWVTRGCRSWYLNDADRNISLWPDFHLGVRLAGPPATRCSYLTQSDASG